MAANCEGCDLPPIHVYASAYNEERLLPFFLQHYSFATEIHLYDNHSTDDTVAIAAADPRVRLQQVDTGGHFSEAALLQMRNHAWKASRGRAAWVLIVDVDEFVHHRNWLGFFRRLDETGVTVVSGTGWAMVAAVFPMFGVPLVEQFQYGVQDSLYNKPCLFRPDAIKEINYAPGGHQAKPVGIVRRWASRRLQLLHYKYLGLSYFLDRSLCHKARLVPAEVQAGYNYHINRVEGELKADYEQRWATRQQCVEGLLWQ